VKNYDDGKFEMIDGVVGKILVGTTTVGAGGGVKVVGGVYGGTTKVANDGVGLGGRVRTWLDGTLAGTDDDGIITTVCPGIVITVTVDGTSTAGMRTGDDGKVTAVGMVIVCKTVDGIGDPVGIVTTLSDGTEVGTTFDGTITKVVPGMVTI
jgi:hypothetical protein